jgi:probable F420-dependent oxidoreductase
VKPFRFGIQMPFMGVRSGQEVAAAAKRAEELGWSAITISDHFSAQLSPVPVLAAIAAVTHSVRLGTVVLANDFRHPAMLAKDAATIDVLSDGRLELGIGAGWERAEYEATGIGWHSAGVRVDRLTEAVTVLKGLWGPDPLTFRGEHYSTTALDGLPKPVREQGITLFIGGGGRRILSLAAREADVVGVNLNLAAGELSSAGRTGLAAAFDERVAWVRDQAGAERFSELELAIRVHMAAVLPDGSSGDDRLAAAARVGGPLGLTAEQVLESPSALVGTIDEICTDLADRRERWGFSYATLSQPMLEPFAPVVARLTGR